MNSRYRPPFLRFLSDTFVLLFIDFGNPVDSMATMRPDSLGASLFALHLGEVMIVGGDVRHDRLLVRPRHVHI